MATRVIIRDKEFNRVLREATLRGLKRGGLYLHQKARQAVSQPNTGKRKRIKRGPNKGKSITVYPNPAPIGQPPRLRTGFGRSNVIFESNDNTILPAVRVGIRKNAIYMWQHEVGIRGKKRPWLVPALLREQSQIVRLIASEKI